MHTATIQVFQDGITCDGSSIFFLNITKKGLGFGFGVTTLNCSKNESILNHLGSNFAVVKGLEKDPCACHQNPPFLKNCSLSACSDMELLEYCEIAKLACFWCRNKYCLKEVAEKTRG